MIGNELSKRDRTHQRLTHIERVAGVMRRQMDEGKTLAFNRNLAVLIRTCQHIQADVTAIEAE